MKRFVLCFVTLVAISANPIYASTIISTFDADAEGWTLNNGILTHLATGGNPGGHLTIEDTVPGFQKAFAAPATFLGDLSAFDGGLLSFDVILLASTVFTELSAFGTVRIDSPSGSASLDLVSGTPASSWTTYSALLTAASWGKSQPAWDLILNDVTEISIITDSFNGFGDTIGFDNPKLTPIPEPSTFLLFAVGLLGVIGIGYLKRKKAACAT